MPTTDNDKLTTNTKPYAVLPLGWAALLLYLTLAPADKLPTQPVWELLSFDTFAHAAFFAVQALLAWFSLRRQRRWPRLARHAGWVVLLGCTAFGALIEALQMALPFNRHGEWSDLLSDSIGTALALGLAHLATPALQRRGWGLGLLVVILTGPAAAQDMPRARATIEALAAPAMHGRGYVQQGEHLAAAYLRGRLQELKLEPLAPDYTQPFTLDVNTFPGRMELALSRSWFPQLGRRTRLRAGHDFIAAPHSTGGYLPIYQVMCYLDSATVVTPTRLAYFMDFTRQTPWCVTMLDRYVQQPAHLPARLLSRLDSAAAIISVVPKLTASLASAPGTAIRIEALPHPLLQPVELNKPSAAASSVGITIDAEFLRNYQTQNLAAVVRGTAQPDSFLVVSAHYDHLGMMGKDVYFPGANDNASGVALLLELAAHYARPENRPAYSVVFLLFGAEEAGLVGSSYFVAHPLIPLKSIKFLINLDLLGTGEQGATVVNGRVFEAPYQRLLALNNAHHYLPALAARGRAANSDHYPFSEAGVPAFFIYTRGGSTAYHDVNDQPAALSLVGFPGAFGLVRDFLNEEGAAPSAKKSR
ncbi:M28 family peptidase [Hymenobacter sp. M29]|uniref:M28 family peptidase n=1 Tax=Hymenobacter mellowenesis TaxID=3063995 RepID=A0ABT9ADD0_9BACT|nr:M28 family peptidase [Hymenobacter sp. M29]MDO7847856.1 M28 family peptidase [Hymenobacter sp. M29]